MGTSSLNLGRHRRKKRVTFRRHEPTDRQVAYAFELSRRAGYRFLSSAIREAFGENYHASLNRKEYAELITWLKARIKEDK